MIEFGISCVGIFPLAGAVSRLCAEIKSVFGKAHFYRGWCLSPEI
jgi:hypothetical protein